MEGILVTIGNDGVSGVSTTVKASADIVVGSEDVDKLALAFVTPLGAKDDGEFGLQSVCARGRREVSA